MRLNDITILAYVHVPRLIALHACVCLHCHAHPQIPGGMKIGDNKTVISCDVGLISSYILPDVLLLASYLFGLYLFSHGETEYLSNLAAKVRV